MSLKPSIAIAALPSGTFPETNNSDAPAGRSMATDDVADSIRDYLSAWVETVEPGTSLDDFAEEDLKSLMAEHAELLRRLLSDCLRHEFPGRTLVLEVSGIEVLTIDIDDGEPPGPDDTALSDKAQRLIQSANGRPNIQNLIRIVGRKSR